MDSAIQDQFQKPSVNRASKKVILHLPLSLFSATDDMKASNAHHKVIDRTVLDWNTTIIVNRPK